MSLSTEQAAFLLDACKLIQYATDQGFMDSVQFKLFLKMVHGCLVNKEDLSFFNGTDYLVHIPFRYLVDSIVLTSQDKFETENKIAEHFKSKMESLVTK